jgi:hypothetical protein
VYHGVSQKLKTEKSKALQSCLAHLRIYEIAPGSMIKGFHIIIYYIIYTYMSGKIHWIRLLGHTVVSR